MGDQNCACRGSWSYAQWSTACTAKASISALGPECRLLHVTHIYIYVILNHSVSSTSRYKFANIVAWMYDLHAGVVGGEATMPKYPCTRDQPVDYAEELSL
jgi:hypothetical protein